VFGLELGLGLVFGKRIGLESTLRLRLVLGLGIDLGLGMKIGFRPKSNKTMRWAFRRSSTNARVSSLYLLRIVGSAPFRVRVRVGV
jgi:hypothetical protein